MEKYDFSGGGSSSPIFVKGPRTPKNVSSFVWNFDQWWRTRWWIRYATVFIEVLRNGQNWAKKLIIGSFWEFFVCGILHPMSYVPRFCQMKDLIKIYVCGKFHHYSICGCELRSFLHGFSIHEMTPFWVFGPLFPKILFDLAEILNRGSLPIRQTQWLKNRSKFRIMAEMERIQSLQNSPFWGPIYRQKTTNIA